MTPLRPYLLFLLPLLWPLPLGAGLVWAERQVTLEVESGQTEAEVSFAFRNAGEEPITITQVRASCGCAAAEMEKTTYAPGEAGTIRLSFQFGSRTGKQIKTVRVTSDDPDQPTTLLSLQVSIPETVRLSPRFALWRPGEPAEPKTIELKVVQPTPVVFDRVKVLGKGFQAELKEIEPGRLYRVQVTPVSTDKLALARIQLPGKVEGRKDPLELLAYARVLGSRSTQPGETPQADPQPDPHEKAPSREKGK